MLLILYEVEILDCSEIATDLLPRQPPDDKTKRWLQYARGKKEWRERGIEKSELASLTVFIFFWPLASIARRAVHSTTKRNRRGMCQPKETSKTFRNSKLKSKEKP